MTYLAEVKRVILDRKGLPRIKKAFGTKADWSAETTEQNLATSILSPSIFPSSPFLPPDRPATPPDHKGPPLRRGQRRSRPPFFLHRQRQRVNPPSPNSPSSRPAKRKRRLRNPSRLRLHTT
ncbi:Hypothetical protein NocV09_01600790 [Nannochloropsis oceanica]